MQQKEEHTQMLLVDTSILPDVFIRVADAKQLLESGKATSATEAARLAGISRSAFYKYKDGVFFYDAVAGGRVLTLLAELSDRPGVLSGVLSAFATAGANILTVNQNIPNDGRALVSISARIVNADFSVGEFIKALASTEGVERVTRISRDD
ncbi:MAG: ACT domain-containing protein [Oscillospiraceae bacterium]|nr:ACT domain-containing protein [Oscillospiraceae bacterium]MDD3833385.1 ACT domain-containing protein [Oscillospiraceae bacterium]